MDAQSDVITNPEMENKEMLKESKCVMTLNDDNLVNAPLKRKKKFTQEPNKNTMQTDENTLMRMKRINLGKKIKRKRKNM